MLFNETFLPQEFVRLYLNVLPWGETLIGLLVFVGFKSRLSLLAGTLNMIGLMFGMCLIQKWDIVGTQMIYIAFYALLILTLDQNRWSLDAVSRS